MDTTMSSLQSLNIELRNISSKVTISKWFTGFRQIPSAFRMASYVKFGLIFLDFEVMVERTIQFLNSNSKWSLE